MTCALLIDFGATHIKSVVTNKKSILKKTLLISQGSSFKGKEVPLNFFLDSIIYHLKNATKHHNIASIIMCCEMHGFFYNYSSNLSNYYSWRFSDTYSSKVIKNIKKKRVLSSTNVSPRQGLPIVTLASLVEKKKIKKKLKVYFLPQLICEKLGYSNNVVHATLAQASGLYLKNKNINDFLKLDIALPHYSDETFLILGEINFKKNTIPVYGGYGDLQTSLYNIQNDEWNINTGTGSQIVIKTKEKITNFETRAFFNGNTIQCISHLPAGRSLNLIANFLKEIRQDKSTDFFWKKIKYLKYHYSADKSLLKTDLNFFAQNKNYLDGGFIKNINEDNFELNNFLISIIRSMANNYASIINQANKYNQKKIINLYGSMSQNIPIFKKILKELTGFKVNVRNFKLDPTLKNMQRIYMEN